MKAILLESLHQPLQVKSVQVPEISSGEVLVRIHAAAFNHRDLWIQKGQYAGIIFPMIPGADGCGVVEKAASTDDKKWIGKEVIINPSINWGGNPKVQATDYVILGLPHHGTFAQYLKIESRLLCEKPAHLSFVEAASIPLAGLTAFRVLFTRARVQHGEKVLITGAGGGVALFAIQFAIAAGCEVYITSGSDEKIAKAVSLGAKGGVNYKKENWHKELQQQSGGFDAIVDSACGDNFAKLVDIAKPAGRIAFYGATLGAFNSGVPAKIFWKQLDILGSTMGNDVEFCEMVNFIIRHQIKPVVDSVWDLDKAQQAIEYLSKGEQFGKIVLSIRL
jgi:NADPH:quinone reductase-like Zn-dependent oxidoreductase